MAQFRTIALMHEIVRSTLAASISLTVAARTAAGRLAPALVLAGAAAAAGCGGFSNVNVPLNATNLLLENRVVNATRAATFTDVESVAAPRAPGATTRPEISARNRTSGGADAGAAAGPPRDADGCFVGLCLSGGGSRSANFGTACMFELERLGLLQKVDYLSSVSGGSVAAAYYCVGSDADWTPEAAQKRLTHRFASDALSQFFDPLALLKATFTDYDRSDLLAETFETDIFSRRGRALTFADLRPDRPRLLMNATDLQTGRRFVFCNETFDQINSDLSKYPIAYGVTASSAVPVVLHPVTLRDYSTVFAQYRHLVDGGVYDNLAVTTLVETFSAHVDAAISGGRPDPYPKGAVFILIDAETDYRANLSSKSDVGVVGSARAAAQLSTHSLLSRVNAATMADLVVKRAAENAPAKDLRAAISALTRDGYVSLVDRTGHTIRVLYISLEQVSRLANAPSAGFFDSLNGIATDYNIKDSDAYLLYQAAGMLIHDKFGPVVRRLVREIDASAGEAAAAPATTAP